MEKNNFATREAEGLRFIEQYFTTYFPGVLANENVEEQKEPRVGGGEGRGEKTQQKGDRVRFKFLSQAGNLSSRLSQRLDNFA